ncbi:hypothetical protein [Celeribacter sp. PS-C1]|uniref:hypothetical protein n=1 Tax=Celeribacter sp. PS-C1 TaxID=2820813 RepID=UPI001CA57017|nr:hypothetical protein [Celeribacter sp. PS-C1]MBW6416735.1 hypothetical protein [Celeribacter sp. PS-C1]
MEFFSAVGLLLTALGAYVTARGVMLTGNRAGEIAVSRIAGARKETYEELPLAQALLNASRLARKGLLLIVAGSFLQMVPVIVNMF